MREMLSYLVSLVFNRDKTSNLVSKSWSTGRKPGDNLTPHRLVWKILNGQFQELTRENFD